MPRRYTMERGSKRWLAPSTMMTLGHDVDLEVVAKYATVPLISVIILASVLQFSHDPRQTGVPHMSPSPSQDVNGSVVHIVPTASTNVAGHTQPSGGSIDSKSVFGTNNSLPTTTSPSSSDPLSLISNGLGSDLTNGVSSNPVSLDPSGSTTSSVPPADTTGTLPVSTDPSQSNTTIGDGGIGVITPVAQAGVDVIPPSSNTNL